MQRSGKEDSTRQTWRKIEGERERERETERGRGKEREREIDREREREREKSVVNGEQRGASEWFQSGFRPLFVLISYLSIGEKTGKNEKRKKRREKETKTKKKS